MTSPYLIAMFAVIGTLVYFTAKAFIEYFEQSENE